MAISLEQNPSIDLGAGTSISDITYTGNPGAGPAGPVSFVASASESLQRTNQSRFFPPAPAPTPFLGQYLPGTPAGPSFGVGTVGYRRFIEIKNVETATTSPTVPVGWRSSTPQTAAIRVYSKNSGPHVSIAVTGIGSTDRDYFVVKGEESQQFGQIILYDQANPTNAYSSPNLFPGPYRGDGITAYTPGALLANQLLVNATPSGAITLNSSSLAPNSTGSAEHAAIIRKTASVLTPTVDYAALRVNSFSPSGLKYFVAFSVGSTETGSINSPGTTTTYSTTSDYRLKDDVMDISDGLDIIDKLKPKVWKWKNDNNPGIGFLAHEVQEAIVDAPTMGMVSGEKDQYVRIGKLVDANGSAISSNVDSEGAPIPDSIEYTENSEQLSKWANTGLTWVETGTRPIYQTMDTSFLIAPLVSATKQLKSQISTLEEKVALLEEKVAELQARS